MCASEAESEVEARISAAARTRLKSRDFLGPLVDEHEHEVRFGVVLDDGETDVLEDRGLAGLGRGHNEAALALADGGHEVQNTQSEFRAWLIGQTKGFFRTYRREISEMGQ